MGFDPATIGLLSSGVGAIGSVVEGVSQAGAAKTNERQARASTELELQQKDREGKALLAEQKVQFLKGGVTLQGTPLEVMGQSAGMIEEERQVIKARGRVAEQQARQRRRSALVGGIGGGLMRAGQGAYEFGPSLFKNQM